MKIRVAIYGFGRLGRAVYHIAARRSDLEVVMVVSDDSPEFIADALMSDAVYASLQQHFISSDSGFHHEERHVHVRPVDSVDVWKGHDVDIVIDTSTDSPTKDSLKQHQNAGAKRVVFAARSETMPTIILGSNEDALSSVGDAFSAGGAAAAAIRPITEIIDSAFGIKHLLTTSIDGMLCGQPCHCDDVCECCGDPENLSPPVLVASVTNVTMSLKKAVSVKVLNDAVQAAAGESYYQGIIGVSNDPVAPDAVIGESVSALVDLARTAVDGDLVSAKIWYDREWGYANRIVELTADYGKVKNK